MQAKKTSTAGGKKKAQRNAETALRQQLKRKIQELNEADDLLAGLPAFSTYNCHGLVASLHFFKGDQLPSTMLDWALALTRRHMRQLYDDCGDPSWAWSDVKKRAELAHPAARFVIAMRTPQHTVKAPTAAADGKGIGAEGSKQAQGLLEQQQQQQHDQQQRPSADPLAFIHFRFEEEEDEAVAYLYEIQVDSSAQGKGLGAHMMRLLELLAWKRGAARVMLTVLHANAGAVALYRKLGFVADDSSPEQHDREGDYAYIILTKRPRIAAASAMKAP